MQPGCKPFARDGYVLAAFCILPRPVQRFDSLICCLAPVSPYVASAGVSAPRDGSIPAAYLPTS